MRRGLIHPTGCAGGARWFVMTELKEGSERIPGGATRLRRHVSAVGAIMDTPYQNIITIEPGKRAGKPCVRGMRITD